MIIIRDLGCYKKTKNHKQATHFVIAKCENCGKEELRQLQSARRSKGCRKCFSGGNNKTHNSSKTKLYQRYAKILGRCFNIKDKDYKDYGGRGISMCDEWKNDFNIFKEWAYSNGYSEGTELTIERVNNNKGYSRGNCIFASRQIQAENMRIKKTSKLGLVGVNKNKLNNKWYSTVTNNKNRMQFGGFNTADEAVLARDNYIIQNELHHTLNLLKRQKL